MKKLNVGVIGVGEIAKARHVPFLTNNSSITLKALCDIKYSRSYATNPRLYHDYNEMLEEEKLDLVDICTPPQTHVEQCVESLMTGCNVLVEKPFTLTVEDCDKILRVAKENNREVCVVHSSLFFPSMMRALEKLPELGTLDAIRVLFDAPERFLVANWIRQMPAGIMDEVMPHAAYIINAFIKPKDCTVIKTENWATGHKHCTVAFEGDVPCVLDINFGEDWEFRVFIEGSKKSMQIDVLNQFVSIKNNRNIPRNKFGVLRSLTRKVACDFEQIFSNVHYSFKPFGHEYIIKKYVSHLVGNGQSPVSPDDIREVVRITQMVNKKFVEKT